MLTVCLLFKIILVFMWLFHFYLSYYPPEHAVFTECMQEDNKSNSNLNNIMKNLFLFKCKNKHSTEYWLAIFDFISEKTEHICA